MAWRHLLPAAIFVPRGTAIIRHVIVGGHEVATEYVCPCKCVRVDMTGVDGRPGKAPSRFFEGPR
jgi:hypothetical protein